MSDTPRTDAASHHNDVGDEMILGEFVYAHFARQLERDRAELLEALKAVCSPFTGGITGYSEDRPVAIRVRAAIAKAEKETT